MCMKTVSGRDGRRVKLSSLRICLTFMVFLTGGVSALLWGQEERVLDEIVAKVNQDVITLTDLQKELRLLRLGLSDEVKDEARFEEVFQRRRRALLKSIVQNKLMLQQAEELGLTANADVEMEASLDRMRQEMGIPNLDVLDQMLQQRGTNLQEYRQSMKDRMVMSWLVQQSVYSKITLLTPEIEEYYQEHSSEFARPAEVELAEILFLTEGKDPEAVRQRAEEALSELRAGREFEEVAKEFSEGPTASRGGNIGKFREGSLAETVEDAVFRLDSGEITGVVEADYGLQILKVVNKSERDVKPLEEVRNQIEQALYERKAEPELKDFMDNLIQQSYIYIADKYREQYDVEGL